MRKLRNDADVMHAVRRWLRSRNEGRDYSERHYLREMCGLYGARRYDRIDRHPWEEEVKRHRHG